MALLELIVVTFGASFVAVLLYGAYKFNFDDPGGDR